jgi:hypothetical protein
MSDPGAETEHGSGDEEIWKSRIFFEPATRVTAITPHGADQAVELTHRLRYKAASLLALALPPTTAL